MAGSSGCQGPFTRKRSRNKGRGAMKVTDVKTFFVDPGVSKNWLFVKILTDEGLAGWGEAYTQSDRDRCIEEHIKQNDVPGCEYSQAAEFQQ